MAELDFLDEPGAVAGSMDEMERADQATETVDRGRDTSWMRDSNDEVAAPQFQQQAEPEQQYQQPQQYQQQPEGDFVPRAALNGVLGELGRMRAERAEAERVNAELLRRIAERTGAIDPPPQPEDVDPIQVVGQQVISLREELARRDFEDRRGAAMQQFQAAIQNDIATARQQAPDWDGAFEHVRQTVAHSFRVQGITDPAAIQQGLRQWDANFTAQAVNAGISPAAALYNFARANGYGGQQQAQAAQGNGRLDRLQQRYDAAAGVPGGNRAASAPNGVPHNARQLAQLNEQQFAQLVDSIPEGQRDAWLEQMLYGQE